jgi:hypothetical protein
MDPYYNALYNTKFAFLQDFFDGLIYEVVLKIEALYEKRLLLVIYALKVMGI